ncbi:hypothetical protein Tco_1448316 [Tanacetum coccineum]
MKKGEAERKKKKLEKREEWGSMKGGREMKRKSMGFKTTYYLKLLKETTPPTIPLASMEPTSLLLILTSTNVSFSPYSRKNKSQIAEKTAIDSNTPYNCKWWDGLDVGGGSGLIGVLVAGERGIGVNNVLLWYLRGRSLNEEEGRGRERGGILFIRGISG